MQFSIRQMLLFTTLAAVTVTAAAVLPTLYGTLVLLTASLVLPGALATIAFTGGPYAKAFCLPAIVPLAFGLYGVAWALGWVVYQTSDAGAITTWVEERGPMIKTVLLSAWTCAALAGLICTLICRLRTQPPQS